MEVPVSYQTLAYELADGVATVTLDRPEANDSLNPAMCADFAALWADRRADEDVRCVVLCAAGEHFSTGLDTKAGRGPKPDNPWLVDDPGGQLSPKRNRMWKPVVCAVQGRGMTYPQLPKLTQGPADRAGRKPVSWSLR